MKEEGTTKSKLRWKNNTTSNAKRIKSYKNLSEIRKIKPGRHTKQSMSTTDMQDGNRNSSTS